MVYQSQEKGCGYASIKNLLEFNGFAHAEALKEPNASKKAPSLGELIAYAKELGLTLSGYKFLEPSGLASCDAFPLLLILDGEQAPHMVMAKKKKGDKYLICDPSSGESWQKESDLLPRFSGVYLKQLSYEAKENAEERMPALKRPRFAYALPLFPILEAALAFLAVFFFKNENYFTLLLLFAAAYCLLVLSRSVFFLASMEQFDAKWSSGLAKQEKGERETALKHYLAYKKASLVPLVNLPENIACFAFVFSLVAINEPLFACLTLIPFGAFFLDKLLLGRRSAKERKRIEGEERSFVESEAPLEERQQLLGGLFSSVRAYTRKELSKKAILVMLCLTSSCLGLLGGEFTSNRFLLFVFSSLYLLNLGEKIFADFKSVETEKRERGYFYHHFVQRDCSNCEEGNAKI